MELSDFFVSDSSEVKTCNKTHKVYNKNKKIDNINENVYIVYTNYTFQGDILCLHK